MDATMDTGPVDDATRRDGGAENVENLIEQAYDGFFGTSPLSSASTTPTPSRSSSPAPDAPNPNKRARLSSLDPSTRDPPPESNDLNAVGTGLKSTSKSRRDRKKSKEARKNKRRANLEATRPTPSQTFEKHIRPSQEHSTNYNATDIPCASTGFVAKPDAKGRIYKLAELLSMGFKLVKWDGRCVFLNKKNLTHMYRHPYSANACRSSKPILDKNGLVVAVLVGAPANDASWYGACDDAYNLLRDKAPVFNFTKKAADHRRGKFPAVNVGISFGGGQMVSGSNHFAHSCTHNLSKHKAPGNLCHPKVQTKVLDDILASTCFIRIAGFASKAFSTWMPHLHGYYKRNFDEQIGRAHV